MTTFGVPRSRTRGVGRHPTPTDTLGESDSGLGIVGVLLWLSGLVRVLLALQSRETFGVEATLALATVLVLPWLFVEWARARGLRRARGG
jgi:hypothetical protein